VLAASPAPLSTHKATNEDHFDPGFHDANLFPAPLQFSYATTNEYGYVSNVPQQVHQVTNDEFLSRSSTYVDWSSAPSQTLLGTYRLNEAALVDPTYSPNWSSAPLPVPQDPYRFVGGELSNPALDWSSAPPLSHEGAYTAVSEGYFEPVLGSVEETVNPRYGNQFNIPPEVLGINPNDAINGFWYLDGSAFTTDPTPEMTSSSGITTQRNGTAFRSPSLPATQIAPNAANTHSSGDRIYCTHMGCPATFRRAADFRRHIKKHSAPGLPCPIKTCDYKSYRHDKLREHGRKKHGMTN
jgi:hypothetical protein